jgi:radical SAM protein with 4Fe4S-binding SPASM domain
VLLAGQKNGQGDQIRKYVSDALRAARKYGLPIKTFNKRSIFDRLLILRSRRRCTWPWAYVFVTWDGFISPCQAIPSQYYMGNLQEDSLEKIWRSEKYRDFRRQLKSGDLPAQCNNCSLL